jgi:hypothetical protein
MTGEVPDDAGHGTFIAGLIRQQCPSAEIAALRVMNADGVVPEHVLTDTLSALLVKQQEEPGWADALVLSLGYYAETPDDAAYTSGLKTLLVALASRGVAVFCAAGNDSTTRPSYPAAFAVDPDFAGPGTLPLASVAALNPDGSTALFSNDGDWVTTRAAGANLVSTAPVDLLGAWQPDVAMPLDGVPTRATIGPSWFRGGFSVWSGTSFAAPVVAGAYLQALAAAAPTKDNESRRGLLTPLLRARRDPGGAR